MSPSHPDSRFSHRHGYLTNIAHSRFTISRIRLSFSGVCSISPAQLLSFPAYFFPHSIPHPYNHGSDASCGSLICFINSSRLFCKNRSVCRINPCRCHSAETRLQICSTSSSFSSHTTAAGRSVSPAFHPSALRTGLWFLPEFPCFQGLCAAICKRARICGLTDRSFPCRAAQTRQGKPCPLQFPRALNFGADCTGLPGTYSPPGLPSF